MADTNSWAPWDNGLNNSNASNNTQNKPNHTLTNEFIDGYINELKDDEFCNIFAQVAGNQNWIIPDNVKTLLEKFKKTRKQFDGVDINWIQYDVFLRELVTSSWLRENCNRKSLKELFASLYKYENWEKDKIDKKIDTLWMSEMLELFDSETKRDKFFKETIHSKVVKKVKHLKTVLKNIEWIEWDSLTPEQQKAIKDYSNNWYASEELINLIKELPVESKRAILLALMPIVSLEELERFSLITEDQSREVMQDRVRDILTRWWISLDEQNRVQEKIKDYLLGIDKKTILIPVAQAIELAQTQNSQTIESIIDKLLNADKIEKLFSEIHKHVNEEWVKNRIKNKEEFFKKIYTLNNKIRWLENIRDENWCVIVWKLPQEYWMRNFYLEIWDFLDKEVQTFERTHDNWIIKEDSKIPNVISYEDLFQILVNLSDSWWEVKIKTRQEIQDEIDAWIIKAFDKENEVNSLDELTSALDEIDTNWKSVKIEVWMVFEFNWWKDAWDKVAIWRVTKVDNASRQIEIASEWPVTTFTFNEFLQAFSKADGKRVTKITDFDSVIDWLQKHKDTGKFKDLIFKRGLILPKNQENNTEHPWVNTFANKDKKCIQIQTIHSDRVDVIIWELEEKEIKWEKNKQKSIKNAQKTTLSLEVFYWFITKNKLAPIIDKWVIKSTEPKPEKKPWKRYSIWNHIFWMHNLITIGMWAKQWLDSIKATLKENNELQAAEFALALGKILPASMRQDLKNRVEQAQKKKMNEKSKELEDMALGLSIRHVRKILETSNAFQHEIEAALIFVMKKHGCLYPMNPNGLYDLKWTYVWYEKLWWKVWDAMYQEYMRDMIADNREATEEWLILKLLAKQQDHDDHKYYPKRRTTIYWEFNWAFKSWRNDSITAWEEEAKTFATQSWRRNLTIWKLKEWRHMFAVGCLKGTLDKWWNATEKNHVPFIILMAWLPKKFHQKVNWDLKWMWIANQLPALFFAQSPAHVDMFEKAALKFAKSVSEECYKELVSIVNDRNSWKKTENQTIEALDKYWTKYWDKLWQKFNTVDDNAFLQSQEDIDVKQYFELWKIVAMQDGFTKDSLDNDVYDHDNALMLYTWWAAYLKKWLKTVNSWSTLQEWVPSKVFWDMLKKLESIKNYKDPSWDAKKTEEWREKLFITLNRIIALYVKSNKWIENTDYYKELKKLWLWLPSKENSIACSYKDIESSNFDKVFSNSYKEFKEGNSEARVKSRITRTALTVNDILELKPQKWRQTNYYRWWDWWEMWWYNPYDYDEAA